VYSGVSEPVVMLVHQGDRGPVWLGVLIFFGSASSPSRPRNSQDYWTDQSTSPD